MGSVEPLRITVDKERQAIALAQELIGISDVDLRAERDSWVVSLKRGHTKNLVVRVLDAVRRSLAGEPTASALVTIKGREYSMQGTPVTINPDREQVEPTIAYAITTERLGANVFVVSLAGEHDLYTAPEVEEALHSVLADGAETTVVDLTETTFLDSTMLHVLLRARNELRGRGRLVLVANDLMVKRVFEISGIDRFFDFYPSRRAAEEEVRNT